MIFDGRPPDFPKPKSNGREVSALVILEISIIILVGAVVSLYWGAR